MGLRLLHGGCQRAAIDRGLLRIAPRPLGRGVRAVHQLPPSTRARELRSIARQAPTPCAVAFNGAATPSAAPQSAGALPSGAAPRAAPPAPLTHAELLHTAHEFVDVWFRGISRGPDEAVVRRLNEMLLPGVVVEADGVRRLDRAEVRAAAYAMASRRVPALLS